ncbi:hypothetical protein Q3O60_13690 [Alkalimonas collagenimarina]|uniref:Orphan protein n=1 Tax=Alkalimonas collagenimarina TaxID=400390 RepID=A0ABT9H1Q0_9GAMM|nr:hypothetical protein [Alkalimonas collagenimarina]MDP4537239.1 hypothetical protein [Alkalimonas collagenimarina]
MSHSRDEKVRLEHEAARLFMRLYEQDYGITMRHIWHNKPARPDVTCYYQDKKLDLEIAHLYGSEAEAMHILGRELSTQTHKELLTLMRMPAEARLVAALNSLLASKAQKTYDSNKVWLVIRNANPLWTRDEMLAHFPKLRIPKQHPFEQIWLIGDMAGDSGLLALFPPLHHPISSDYRDELC